MIGKGSTGGYENASPQSELTPLAGVDRVRIGETRDAFRFRLQQQANYRSAAFRNVMSLPADVFGLLAPEEDENSAFYLPSPVMRRLLVFRKRRAFLGILGKAVLRRKGFNVMIGRHRTTEPAGHALIADPELFDRIYQYAKSQTILIDIAPYRATLRQLLACHHPRRDVNIGMFFTYIGALFGLAFFALDIARDIFGWDAHIASFLHGLGH